MSTDTRERELENLIVRVMTGRTELVEPPHVATETANPVSGGTGWLLGDARDYIRDYCVDGTQLRGFLRATQPRLAEELALDVDGPTRRGFLARLQGEITRRGTVDVLRHGIKHGPHDVVMFYGTPSPGNVKATDLHALNRFSVTRQLRYSRDETALALDLALFVNGLPVFTIELKNSLTRQTVIEAIEQYQRDRDPREPLFALGRCVAHFAVDDQEVRFCTHLRGRSSWFLPFNQGWNDGAGNPPNPEGLKTDYLWRRVLTPGGLTDILENYAQLIRRKDPKTKKVQETQVFPRYHQLEVVRSLLADARAHGAGRRYLIQHSAGSGKSNSIAWLAHQLIGLQRAGRVVFDAIVVVTDRRVLDEQICETIKQFAQVSATIGHAERAEDLRRFLEGGRKLIITTVQKFPVLLDGIGVEPRGRSFAILIDEAHSSQGGKSSAAVSQALSETEEPEEEATIEDRINRIMEGRKLLPNASYFAFTATPKSKTLEIFGTPTAQTGPEGRPLRRAFHSYTMKQAIEEGFILDVLRTFTPIQSYYKLVKLVKDDPAFDPRRAIKKLRAYVESHDHAIRVKAEIMVDHFHDQVWNTGKIGGKARAMVVTDGIARAIQYFEAISAYLIEKKHPYKAIVAFSGEHEHAGVKVSEASLNGFPASEIPDRIQEDPYRILVCADKFQTGYDEPLLHTMYVDKVLSGVKAVQTLSRLNRAHPQKRDVFVLDFMNSTETIRAAFAPYYRTTVLSGETDPNRLHDLQATLEELQVFSRAQVDELVALFLESAERPRLDSILDAVVETYRHDLDEDSQIKFKGSARAFCRTYGFLSAILPFARAEWERLFIFLNLLLLKLPAPKDDDLSKGILDAIDMDSYRTARRATLQVTLQDKEGVLQPATETGGGRRPEPELEQLSEIIKAFNEHFGNISWEDEDRIHKMISEAIPLRVSADVAYQNACRNSDRQNARIEHDRALTRAMVSLMKDDTQLFKLWSDNQGFRRWLSDMSFSETYIAKGRETRA